MPLIDVANVACGFHASDFNHMRATVRLAKQHGVKVGAHPSLPDRQGFGRREMAMKREEMANCLIYQIGALKGFLEAEGMVLNHIKPHGSLFGIVHAETPDGAIAAMASALDGLIIEGIVTNRDFLRRMVAHPAFRSGETLTGFIDTHRATLFPTKTGETAAPSERRADVELAPPS